MTATNKPMTGAQLDELMAVAMRMQSDSEKMGDRSVSMFAYAVQVAVLEIRETRCKYGDLQSQNADLAVQLANAESKCRELAAENVGLKNFIINDCHVAHIEPETFYEEEITVKLRPPHNQLRMKKLNNRRVFNVNHLMIDLETMGTKPNAPVVAIGAVFFDPLSGELGPEYYTAVNLASAMEQGAVPDGDTIIWWLKQSPEARSAICVETLYQSRRPFLN